jgi:hypothetical protein
MSFWHWRNQKQATRCTKGTYNSWIGGPSLTTVLDIVVGDCLYVHLLHVRITKGCLTIRLNSIHLYILSTKTSQITIGKYQSQKANENNPQQNSYKGDINLMKNIQSDWKVAQPTVWLLVLARNECDEVELVDKYVGMTLQKLCRGKLMSHNLTPSQQ